ncbi:hypothetical protein A9Q79_09910 [Methylophaga sp. 42_25_T18]|nr:hypothetical protein A9Q79_09910 [Methylophaga sp. 42_25_T18]OUR88844.1 hypothetical protein A9Q92_02050 [Methylophaga sp. 42_8_T64]
MAKHYYLIILGLFITANLYGEDDTPSVELIEFLADWTQEDDIWFETETSVPTVTTEQEADDEPEK